METELQLARDEAIARSLMEDEWFNIPLQALRDDWALAQAFQEQERINPTISWFDISQRDPPK